MKLEKMTKEELINVINDLNKKIEGYEAQIEHFKERECEFNLLKFLYQEYIPVMEENTRLNNDVRHMEWNLRDLQDLCERQQKIIDSRCD